MRKANVHTKSKLIITDLGSKTGTFIDSDKIKDGSRTLDKSSYVLRLGQYETLFHIKWQPKVFTFTQLSRTTRQAADPLASQRAILEPLDIKCITEFLSKATTHVIAKKRNTASCLQALVHGRNIVTEGYVNAVATVAQVPEGAGDELPKSKFELDFASAWPNELDFLPGPGTEPNARPEHDPIFSPAIQRSEMFSKYCFVFADSTQYQTFLPVVSGGSGKAVLHDVAPPEDNPDFEAFFDFVKSCAGKKGDAAFRMSQYPANKGGVIVVRPPDPNKVGGAEFFQRIDLALDQRSIEQNEFLDAILSTDASSLRRALEVEMEDADDVSSARPASSSVSAQASNRPAYSNASNTAATSSQPSPAKRKGRRNLVVQKLTNFDNFDPSQIVEDSPPPSQDDSYDPQRRESFSVSGNEIEQSQPKATQTNTSQRSRKRPAESQGNAVESTEQVLDNLFTGAAAMKKRRLEEAASGRSVFTPGAGNDAEGSANARPQRKTEKEQDEEMQRIMQERREEQERRRQQDEEKLRNALEGMNVSEMRNLAQIEEMEIKPRQIAARSPNDGGADVGSRWKPEWNGRANWKKFKKHRPGQQAGSQTDGPSQRRVIVTLEPYDPHSIRGEDDFWLQPNTSTRHSQASARASQVSATNHREDDDTDTFSLRRRIEKSRADDGRENELSELLPEEIGGRPRDPALRAQLAQTAKSKTGLGRSMLGQSILDSNPAARGKASSSAAGRVEVRSSNVNASGAGRKRGRDVVEVDDEDDDDGGLKFRRRRKV
ncbi:hypothetical protein ANO11243_074880 [Dothideomycetidae sp. 11243]|nr:hypothetical protein ANO11243_074880 [fungal sp. No.11243]